MLNCDQWSSKVTQEEMANGKREGLIHTKDTPTLGLTEAASDLELLNMQDRIQVKAIPLAEIKTSRSFLFVHFIPQGPDSV